MSDLKNGFKIAFVYVGLIIGAGFASGQEIMRYFVNYNTRNLSGIVIAALMFVCVAFLILKRTYKYGISTFDEYIRTVAGRAAPAVRALVTLFMFAGFFTMLSGSGTLFCEIFGIGRSWGIWLMAAASFAVLASGSRGIIALNTVLVPVIVLGMSYLCIASVTVWSVPAFAGVSADNYVTSALRYVSYNTITAGAVLIPLRPYLSRRSAKIGAFFGGGVLGILIFLVWFALKTNYAAAVGELPLFTLSEMGGGVFEKFYAVVLLLAMYTTAASNGFGILAQVKAERASSRVLCSLLFCLAAVLPAYVEFSALVEHLYGFFGWVGMTWMLLIIASEFFRVKNKKTLKE